MCWMNARKSRPVADEMRIAQLKGHLKHCENEVNEAKNKLEVAEVHWHVAYVALIAALEEADES